jgi:amino acid transporter
VRHRPNARQGSSDAGRQRVRGAWFQNVTVVLKFLPLLFVGVVGWFFVRSANFGPFNASGGSFYSCIGIAARR